MDGRDGQPDNTDSNTSRVTREVPETDNTHSNTSRVTREVPQTVCVCCVSCMS